MALITEVNRNQLKEPYDTTDRKSSSSSSRSDASSPDFSEIQAGATYKQLRKQSSPANLSICYPSTAWSTPSPVRSRQHRSQSVKNPSGHRRSNGAPRRQTIAQPYTLTFEDAFRSQSGTSSSFNDDEVDNPNIYRLRKFSVTPRGEVQNRGDSYRPRSINSSLINTPVGSLPNELIRSERLSVSSAYSTTETSLSGEMTSSQNPRYRVRMSGCSGVGKTALTNQFLTSEYMNGNDTLIADEDDMQTALEKSVCVLLDGQESELDFQDLDSCYIYEDTPVDAHVIVYNVVHRTSFEKAIDILFELKQLETTKNQAIILVGNKSDLVRARIVSTDEGKSIASSYDCKFIETSAGLNHNVDELLVGILTQIRLKEKQAAKKSKNRRILKYKGRSSKKHSLTYGYDKAIGFISDVFLKTSLSKSCGNLQVL